MGEQALFSRGRWEKYASDLEELLVSHSEAEKWIKYVTDNGGRGPDEGWLLRGAGLEQDKKKAQASASEQQAALLAAATGSASSSSPSSKSSTAASIGL
jgi:hypothetical protein